MQSKRLHIKVGSYIVFDYDYPDQGTRRREGKVVDIRDTHKSPPQKGSLHRSRWLVTVETDRGARAFYDVGMKPVSVTEPV